MYDSFVQIIAGALSVETLISVIVSIITSLIAALIFYYVVEYRPARRRQKELTPILMNYYRWIHFYLVIFFRDIFKMNLFSSVPDIQKRIIAGEIGTDEWCVALYNKCLNDTYLYGDFSRELVVIGPSLSVTSEKIKKYIKFIERFYKYLSSAEIAVFHNLEYMLDNIVYSTPAVRYGLKPVNPTMSCYVNNINDIYKDFLELQSIYYEKNYAEKEFLNGKVIFLMAEKKYKQALDLMKKDDENLWQKAVCFFEICELNNCKRILCKAIKATRKGSYVGQRYYIEHFLKNDEITAFLRDSIGNSEFEKCLEVLKKEKADKEHFYYRNKIVMEWYSGIT